MKKLILLLFVIFSIVCGNSTFAQSGKIVHVSKPGDHLPAEVALAINPKNKNNFVAAFITRIDTIPGITNYTYSTMDGGETWKKVLTSNPENRVEGDDGLAFSSEGIVFHSYLSFYGLWKQKSERPADGIYVSASTDGGLTWPVRAPVIDHINTAAPMEDKPYVVTDNSPNSPYKNNVYLAWTHFQVYGSHNPADSSQIFFSRSVDSGKTISRGIRISDTGGDCIDSSNTVEGAFTAVGLEGQVYVVWAGPKGLVFTESKDGGKTFGPNKVIGFIYHGWDFDVPGIDRANGMPVAKVDISNSPYRGTIYVNWADDRYGDPDILLKYSRDEGKSWSNPIRVNNDKIDNGKYQFFSWMAVDPIDGSVNIVYYDRKNLDSTMTGLTLARSIDGGKTFVNYKINQKPFNCNPKLFFGDYSGIDAYDGRVVPIYMYFKNENELAVNAAVFDFKPGTQEQIK